MTDAIIVNPVAVRLWGPRACFTRPEYATECVSYMVPTPAAVRGILEAILWQPDFHWRVREIHVLKPIQFFNETRNEVAHKASRSALTTPYIADNPKNRLQRHTCGLHDVSYHVIAEAVPFEDNAYGRVKWAEVFNRRIRDGSCFSRPYFGRREWSAFFAHPEQCIPLPPIPVSMDLGRMHFDFRYIESGVTYEKYRNNVNTEPVWFQPRMENGIVRVPDDLYEVAGGSRGRERLQPQAQAS